MSLFKNKILPLFMVVLVATGCGRDLSSNVYTSDSTLSLTMQGKIISVRKIVIKENDKMGNNGTGILSGAALGAAGGSAAGKGGGSAAALVGGAIIGGVVGAAAEGALSQQDGFEYIVKVDAKNLGNDYYEGTGAVRQAISSAVTNGLITVVQGADEVYSKGQNVYVIFSDKRTRIIPAS